MCSRPFPEPSAASQPGFEPGTPAFVVPCSVQLSYWDIRNSANKKGAVDRFPDRRLPVATRTQVTTGSAVRVRDAGIASPRRSTRLRAGS